MANDNMQDTGKVVTDSFIKGLNKDSDPSYVSEGMWTHAVNASNNSIEGDVGSLTNEISNFLCAIAGSTMPASATHRYVIGAIYLFSDKWVIFTAGHTATGQRVTSEIGLLEEERCIYRPLVQDACLRFDKRYLITGVSRKKEDCSWQVYWADSLNPDRYLNVGNPDLWPSSDYNWLGGGPSTINYYSNGSSQILWPGVQWVQDCGVVDECNICIDDNALDCDRIRLARLMETPCLNLELGESGGTLANGTYFATIAYSISGQKVTDYFSPSNNQFIFTPNDLEGSLTLNVSADTVNFDEFILVLVQNINQGTVAKQIGIYSTSTTRIALDQIDPTTITVPIKQLPIQTPVFEKSDQISEINNYLLRVGPTSKFDFNYQPLANLIKTRWASVEYPADYYVQGGNKTSYLRDEVYAFFIRWVYNTGDKTASYHIPGRAPGNFTIPNTANSVPEASTVILPNCLATDDKVFEVYNTATLTAGGLTGTTTDDGGTVLAVGEMGYWQSTERYPDNRPDIWNSSTYCWTTQQGQSGVYDLCGEYIRHHKFPENFINNNSTTNTIHFRNNPNPTTVGDDFFIRIMGVYFENIVIPKDQDGNDIPGIAGYEILRGSREGNKTIIAKGMVNNFRSYNIQSSAAKGRTGLYANYPFNTITPISPDTGLMTDYDDPYIFQPGQFVPRDIVSFHSPDTMFRTPFLSTNELKLYGYLTGYTTQQFIEPDRHPKFKLLADAALYPMFLTGIAEAIISMLGKRTDSTPALLPGTGVSESVAVAYAAYIAAVPIMTAASATYNTFYNNYYTTAASLGDIFLNLVGLPTSIDVAEGAIVTAANVASLGQVNAPIIRNGTIELPAYAYLPTPLRVLGGLNQFFYYFSEGADVALGVIYALLPYRQYALQQLAYGFYGQMNKNIGSNLYRFKMAESFYIRDNIQDVNRYENEVNIPFSYTINNLKRPDSVVIRTKTGPYFNPAYPDGVNTGPGLLNSDKSLVTLGTIAQAPSYGQGGFFAPGALPDFENPTVSFGLPIGSHYAAIKGRVRNQYGQLGGIKQIIITPCEQKIDVASLVPQGPYTLPGCVGYYSYKKIANTPVLFNGDTYINRYTEKNTMCFYYNWLYAQPDGFEYNYYLYNMIPNIRFNVNSIKYDVSDLTDGITLANPTPGTGAFPSRFYNMDYYRNSNRKYNYETNSPEGFPDKYPGLFGVKESAFYIANSSIRDFFVESEVLVDFRKQGVYDWEKHFDPYRYTNYRSMFNADPNILGRGNSYIYDYSLSVSKLYNQYFSSGNLQDRYYNPETAQFCYSYYPNRIVYSLPQQDEAIKDSWFMYLANNYKDFRSQISGVKSINKSGVIITFKNDSPLTYQGVDTLETDLGTKITIGDGILFSQPEQAISNADRPYEYGASQNKFSVISTPVGIYYVSQSQGKIFSLGQGLQEISQAGMKWWFSLFLPYKLIEDFPNYPWQDNPVAGIGCQSIYDNTNSVLYFTKKDYKLKPAYKGKVEYVPISNIQSNSLKGDYFTITGQSNSRFLLGDPAIFDSASWTISYDPKNQFWISFHDWHPDLMVPTKHTFMSTKMNGVWKHNDLCYSFCNFYGKTYPFEIEIPFITGQTVTTTRSIEYILECYRRSKLNCVDQFHVLDYNFDNAVIYNSEQVSGYLNLNIFPKNNITLSLQYPKLNTNLASYDILFSKEENKYRFNQFWDITKQRAEFPNGSGYPPTGPLVPGTTELLGNYGSENIWVTSPDGYNRILNSNNLDYNKSLLQRKKFRHYINFLSLKRNDSTDINMILKIVNSKTQASQR
jgi:hypothetical protein